MNYNELNFNDIEHFGNNGQLNFRFSNTDFQSIYFHYVVKAWKDQYFAYDYLKQKYNRVIKAKPPNFSILEKEIFVELIRINKFLDAQIQETETDLKQLDNDWEKASQSLKKKLKQDQEQRTFERTLRSLYQRSKDCIIFYKLNDYEICKIIKKIEKVQKSINYEYWKTMPSYEYYNMIFKPQLVKIEDLKEKCINVYTKIYRQNYQNLAIGELEFIKNDESENEKSKYFIGMNFGICLAIVII